MRVLTPNVIAAALESYAADGETQFLAQADLAEQTQVIEVRPTTLSLDETANLWRALGGVYELSLTYLATSVSLTAEPSPHTPPVQ